MERRRIRFIGRVQGVGFRATVRTAAGRFAVGGWVRNEEDGSVTVEVQGRAEEVDRFLKEVRVRMAENIQAETAEGRPVEAGESRFEIRR